MSIKYGAKVNLDMKLVMRAFGYNVEDVDIVNITGDPERCTVSVYLHGDVIQTRGRSTVRELHLTEIPHGCEWPVNMPGYEDESDSLNQLLQAQCMSIEHSWEKEDHKGPDYTITHKVCTTCGMESKKLVYDEEV